MYSNKSLAEYQEKRMKFSSQWTFLLSALGYAAGFGSVWRFPYLVFKNGGGTFLIPYFILLFVLAIPLFYLEIALGQLKGIGLAHLLQLEQPKLHGFGFVGIIICAYISSYYNLIMAYANYYLWNSFKSPLPWAVMDEGLLTRNYFYNDMLQISTGLTDLNCIVWPIFIAYIFSLILVYICIKEGVETSGKVAIVTASAPYVLLIILLIRGLTLEGASSGLYYLFKPDLVKIFDPMVWVDAANQVIFQMSVGLAVLVLYGSYRQKYENISKFSIIIPLLTALCGLLAACVVFSYIGYISVATNTPIQELPVLTYLFKLSGPDLAFVLYPAILASMPYPNAWSIVFFSCIILLGIDTQFGLVEGIAGTIEDAFYGDFQILGFQFNVQNTRLFICIINGLVGIIYCTDIGFYLLNFVDNYATGVGFLLIILFEIQYFCKGNRFLELVCEIQEHNNHMPEFIRFSLNKICPYGVSILLFFSLIEQIKDTFEYEIIIGCFGWCISLAPFAVAYYIYKRDEFKQPIIMNEIELKLV